MVSPAKARARLGRTPRNRRESRNYAAKFRLGESVPEINPADHKKRKTRPIARHTFDIGAS